MAPKMNVYEKIMTGIFKLFLLMAIGALTLSRFTGFEWRAPPQRETCLLVAADSSLESEEKSRLCQAKDRRELADGIGAGVA